MSRHIKAEIKPGDRHDRILRLLCGGEDWRAKSPSDCCPLWYWGIANEQRWKDDYKASYYRIAPSARQPSGADAITAYDKLKGAK